MESSLNEKSVKMQNETIHTVNSIRRDRFKRFVTLGSMVGTIFIVAALILWDSIFIGIDVQCPFKLLFDLDCPGCGITRMCKSILKGNFYQAFRYNVYVFSTLPILAVVFIWQSYQYIMHNKLLKYIDAFLIIYAILMITFGVLRNTELFSFLAPVVIK